MIYSIFLNGNQEENNSKFAFFRFYLKFTDIIPVLDNSCPDNADCSLGVLILDQGKLNFKKIYLK